ncbi:MAG: 50S ribosomal protein L25, partial [Alistipes sp.]
MKTIKLQAAARADFGKKAAKSARHAGLVPCVIYGGGENLAFTVDVKAVKPLIYTPNSYIVEIELDGKVEKAVLREVQFHPVREEIL